MFSSKTRVVDKFCVLLIVVGEAGNLSTFPREVAHIGGPMERYQEEEPVGKNAPLADVFELHGIDCLYHFPCFNFLLYYNIQVFLSSIEM